MTINVGLGTGSKSEQLAHLQLIIGAQEKAIALGLVTPKNIYESAKELTKIAGHKDTDRFFTPPEPQGAGRPIPPPQDPKQAEMAAKAQVEQAKTQADAAHQQMKLQADMAFEQQKFELEKQLKLLDAQIRAEQHRQQMTLHAVRAGHDDAPGPDGQPSEKGSIAALIAGMMDTLHRMSAPKRARKLPDGSWITEHVGDG